jgi:hypothetical protein
MMQLIICLEIVLESCLCKDSALNFKPNDLTNINVNRSKQPTCA